MSHRYKKNYLKQVIFRIDFEKVSLSDFDTFKTMIGAQFDTKTKQKGRVGNFELQVDSGEIINTTEEFDIWQFVDTNTGNKFEAAPTYCLLEYFAYKDSSILSKNIEELCTKFVEHHKISQVSRVGLRYINQIEINGVKRLNEWQNYILNDLLIAPKVFVNKNRVPTRILNQLELKSETFNTVYKYGIWNDKYPSPITSSAYIIDIDCFTRLPVDLEESGLVDIAMQLNKEAENIFELSITPKLRKEMEK